MLKPIIDNLSSLIGINNLIIPNVITLIVICILLFYTLKGSLTILVVIGVYGVSMGILELVLGISSIFNIFSLFF